MHLAAAVMMPTFHPDTHYDDSTERGFSLLEMLVVLAIMGLMLSLISVRMVSSIESARFTQTSRTVMENIKLTRLQAMLDKTSVQIIPSEAQFNNQNAQTVPLDLPEDWKSTGDVIAISKSGYCTGGNLTLTDPTGRKISYSLSPPRCEAKRVVD